jgi:hypothetical protein
MMRKYAWMCLPVLILVAVGCSSKGTITGTVTYKGTPIPEGSVQFMPENGAPTVSAVINDGQYTAEKVPVGPAKVAIASLTAGAQENAMTKMMMSGGKGGGPPPDAKIPEEARKLFSGGGAPKKGLQIPEKYSDLQNSGLTYTVTGGKQTKDFNLE